MCIFPLDLDFRACVLGMFSVKFPVMLGISAYLHFNMGSSGISLWLFASGKAVTLWELS